MIESNLDFDTTPPAVSVTEMLKQFPHVSPRVLVALAFVALLERTVKPFRLCQCGCGESVHGKARLASPACRQRVSRQRRAILATSGRQFNLVIQYEIPVPIPTVPPPAVHISETYAPAGHCVLAWWTGHKQPQKIYFRIFDSGEYAGHWGTTYDASLAFVFPSPEAAFARWRKTHAWPEEYEHCIAEGSVWTEPANRASQPSQPTEPANRASQPSQSYSANCDGSEIFLDFR